MGTSNKDNPRKKSYEDKMDKQRLEHILFSGDQSGPLNQQKERMRQKLQKKQSQKKKNKKTQSLPNGSSIGSHLALDAAKKQKANGDNTGYFLTDIRDIHKPNNSSSKSAMNGEQNKTNNKNKKKKGKKGGAKKKKKKKKKKS